MAMMMMSESARKLLEPDFYQLFNLVGILHGNNENLRQQGKALFDYTKENYSSLLIQKLFDLIPLCLPTFPVRSIQCYNLLSDILPPLWNNISSIMQEKLKSDLCLRIGMEQDYEILKACSSCVSNLACLLFPTHQWRDLFHYMLINLNSDAWHRKLGTLLCWYQLIPKCPEVFVPYVDTLILGFRLPIVPENHLCGAYVRASVQLILNFATPASYPKFNDLFVQVITTLLITPAEEAIEDLIVLAGVHTGFLKVHIDLLIESMLQIYETLLLEEKIRQLAIEFIVTMAAEDRKNGCGIMQMVPKEQITRLLNGFFVMLSIFEDDPSWGYAISDDKNEGEYSSWCSYAMESLDRLAIALGGKILLPCLPLWLSNFLTNEDWKIRHTSVTLIGLISEGCSQALLLKNENLVQATLDRINDGNPRVRWATIRTIGQLSKYLSPHFQERYDHQLLLALMQVLDDFGHPRVQRQAASAIQLFSHNCRADVLKPYLQNIVSRLLLLLQSGIKMLEEAALETLASLAISSQEDFACIYMSIVPYLKVFLSTATKDTSRTLLAKTLECLTMATMTGRKIADLTYVRKIFEILISLQATQMEIEDPMRRVSILACGRLCKALGADFLPYLGVAVPIVLKSARLRNYLSVSNNSDTDDESMIKVTAGNIKIGIRSALLEEKAIACHMLCCFATELKEELHFWVKEIVSALVPMLTFELSEEVRIAAIYAMPLLLNSAVCAVKKGLYVTGCGPYPVQELSDTIIPSLLEALKKESKVRIQASLLEAFNKSFQVPGSSLSEHQAANFVDGISKVLSACSYHKMERERRVREQNDLRELELLKEEVEQHLTICRNIGICLGTMVKNLKELFLPLFDKFLPYVSLMWSTDPKAEKTEIVKQLFRDIAEQCREKAFKYYEEQIHVLPKIYHHENPYVPQIVATAIGICAEFGAESLKSHTPEIYGYLRSLMEQPDEKKWDNIRAHEAAISTCGKLIQFFGEGIYGDEFTLLWVSHLPMMFDLDEAKINHELLCSVMETSEQKEIRPHGSYFARIITIFAEILSAGTNLATEETKTRIINLLKKFKREMQLEDLNNIFEELPPPKQIMLNNVLSTL